MENSLLSIQEKEKLKQEASEFVNLILKIIKEDQQEKN